MIMYKWDMNYLIELYNDFAQRIGTEQDEQKAKELENILITIDRIINYWIENYEEPESYESDEVEEQTTPSLKTIISDDKETLKRYSSYKSLIYDFINNLASLTICPRFKPQRINCSKNKLVTVSKDFFDEQKGEIAATFGKIYKTLPTHLAFRSVPQEAAINMQPCAQTLPIYGSGESFYDIGLNHTAQDYLTIFHEFGHGITSSLNPDYLWEFDRYCIAEVESIFWELVGSEYISEHLGLRKEAFELSVINLHDYLYDADLLCSKMEIYRKFKGPNLYSRKILSSYLKKKLDYNNQQIKHTLNSLARENMHYLISYLIAVDLYMIYRTNKDLALELLLKIMKSKNLSADEYLDYINKLGIKPGEHIKDYVNMLITTGKELGYGKRLYFRS